MDKNQINLYLKMKIKVKKELIQLIIETLLKDKAEI